MGDLEVRTTARLQYAEEGRDLPWRSFYQEDICALQTKLREAQEERDCDGRSGQRCDRSDEAPCLFHAHIFLKAAETRATLTAIEAESTLGEASAREKAAERDAKEKGALAEERLDALQLHRPTLHRPDNYDCEAFHPTCRRVLTPAEKEAPE